MWPAVGEAPKAVLDEGASSSTGAEGRAGSVVPRPSSHPSLLSRRGCSSASPEARSLGVPPEHESGPEGADEVERAEREAIQAEPTLWPEGSPERQRQDWMQERMVRGLLDAAMRRPPAWMDSGAAPTVGAWCTRCRGGR